MTPIPYGEEARRPSMATAVEPTKQTSTPKYESFVEQQLTRARQRIRLIDLATAGLVLLVAVFAYAVSMALLDNWLVLSVPVRQMALAVFLLGVGVFVAVALLRPLLRPINP